VRTALIPARRRATALIPARRRATALVPARRRATALVPARRRATALIPAISSRTNSPASLLGALPLLLARLARTRVPLSGMIVILSKSQDRCNGTRKGCLATYQVACSGRRSRTPSIRSFLRHFTLHPQSPHHLLLGNSPDVIGSAGNV